MGTNFTWHDLPCNHCGRFDEVHVGKSSAGWCFLFHAYEDEYNVFGFPVRSRADWRRVFTERSGVLVDEYGNEWAEPLLWLAELPAPDVDQLLREDERMRSYRSDPYRRDPEGFRIETGDFS